VNLEAVVRSEQGGALGMGCSGRGHLDSFGRLCGTAFEERIVGSAVRVFCQRALITDRVVAAP
jgi:hypothetical protein